VPLSLDAIRAFFGTRPMPPSTRAAGAPPEPSDDLRIAACALLLEMAHADGVFTDDERGHIEEALVRHFGLDAAGARELMARAEAERRDATDLFQFTSVITRQYDEGQRMVLAELLWRVVDADGRLAPDEDALARRLASLLELRPGYLAEARNRSRDSR
jgi:uncharacterized tellurite resistance protein B-like protein